MFTSRTDALVAAVDRAMARVEFDPSGTLTDANAIFLDLIGYARAEICGRPLALAGALRKLEEYAHRIPMQVSPAVAPLAQVNPLAAFGGGMARMFSTHPPTEDRVRRLEQLARAA